MIDPQDLPPPDLIDLRGRITRGIFALAVGAALGAAAYLALCPLFESGHIYESSSVSGKYKFLAFFVTATAGIGFWITRAALQYLADKRWRQELIPRAKLRTGRARRAAADQN